MQGRQSFSHSAKLNQLVTLGMICHSSESRLHFMRFVHQSAQAPDCSTPSSNPMMRAGANDTKMVCLAEGWVRHSTDHAQHKGIAMKANNELQKCLAQHVRLRESHARCSSHEAVRPHCSAGAFCQRSPPARRTRAAACHPSCRSRSGRAFAAGWQRRKRRSPTMLGRENLGRPGRMLCTNTALHANGRTNHW